MGMVPSNASQKLILKVVYKVLNLFMLKLLLLFFIVNIFSLHKTLRKQALLEYFVRKIPLKVVIKVWAKETRGPINGLVTPCIM